MGRSSWQDEALSRWGGDRVEDADGWRLWLRDPDLGRLWALRPPAGAHGGLRIGPGGFGWTQRDHGIETRVEVCVSARDAELRTVHVRNRSDRPRALEITGCLELVLHDPSADAAHPAFSKLFVQTAWDPAAQALVASRRPRSPEEQHVRVAHALVGEGRLEWETDRARFLGRGRSAARPAALCTRRPLSGSVGSVLDPVFAARRTLVLGPGEERRWTFVLAAARSRAAALGAAASLPTETAIDAEFGAARGAAQATLDRFGLSAEDAELLPQLTGALLYGAPRLRAGDDVLRRAGDDAAARAGVGVLPGVPVVLVPFDQPGARKAWEVIGRALAYCRFHGIDATLVAVDGGPSAAPTEPGLTVAGPLQPNARLALEAGPPRAGAAGAPAAPP